jgi:hypothetical protein
MAKSKKDKAAFRAAFDPNVIVPNKIRAGIESLAKAEGPDGWEEEIHFLKRCGINAQTVSPHREKFSAHIVEARTPGRKTVNVWFADPKVAAAERKNLYG